MLALKLVPSYLSNTKKKKKLFMCIVHAKKYFLKYFKYLYWIDILGS